MDPQLQKILQQVAQVFQSGNSDQADLILKEALDKDINIAGTIFEFAIAYANSNRFLEASTIFSCLQLFIKDDARIPYNLGLVFSLQGKHHLALEAYDLALEIQPNDFEVLINKGSTYNDIKNFVLALETLEQAIQIKPDIAEAWFNKAIALNNLNFHIESIDAYKEAINLNPCFYEAWSSLSIPFSKLKRFSEASNSCDKALTLKPDYHVAWYNKGNTLNELKRFDEALVHYDQALTLKPDYHVAWYNKGNTLNELKRFDEALVHYDQALTLKPDYHEAWSNKGIALNELKRFDEALVHYDQALTLKPDYHEAWSNKGIALNELKRFDEALVHYDQALTLKPDYHEAWSNKGIALNELKRFDEALVHYDQALTLKPDYHVAWYNKGNTLNELKRFDEALVHYDQALTLKPDYHEASWNKCLSLLLQGDFKNGLPLYENRWDSVQVGEIGGKRIFNEPTWLGKGPLKGKTILIYGEQGLGDFIQFCRYIKLVSDLGANVILEAPHSLVSLMEGLDGVSQIVTKGEDLPLFDFQCPLLSLPLALNTNISTIPATVPYLNANPIKVASWKLKLGEKRKKRVGVVWSSMSGFKGDSKRSLSLADFVKALPMDKFEYICLQKELKEFDQEILRIHKNIKFFGDELKDFSDTAALIECVDFVVSTCTSIPHLSAGLGKETWVLLSHLPDWRWFLNREDSPWYPSIKLYRQPAIDDWNSVLAKVKFDLNSR